MTRVATPAFPACAALRILAVLVALLVAAGCAIGSRAGAEAREAATSGSGDGSPAPGRVRVAAASDLRFAMEELVASWQAARPDVAVDVTYGSSGNFVAQIREGAPFDVLFSADAAYPQQLEAAGLAPAGSTRLYAIGQLAVWVPSSSPLAIEERGLDVVRDASVRTVAIANPEHAPYGRAAVAAMEHAGVADAVRPKLVLGENVSQAAQFVESGNADVGVIALSLAIAPPLRDEGRHVVVPATSYPTLEQGVLVLDAAADPGAARAFVDFVLAPDGRAVLDRYGFLAPP